MRASVTKSAEIAAGFPRLRSRLATPTSEYNAAPATTFEHGLKALLNGLTADLET
ncbi:hypothetical protein [Streptomyces sp. URMC 124]|uniref:hypothetical protein n=1 Tax=Streptomyces sp. URMC 124 TaxID=3423405 RepID=UPI003F1CCE4D